MYISQIVKKWQSQKEGITESKSLEEELNKLIQQLSNEYKESHDQLSKHLPNLIQNLRKEKLEFKEDYPDRIEKVEKEIVVEEKKNYSNQIEPGSQADVKVDYDWNREVQEFTKGLFEKDDSYKEVIDIKKKIPKKLNIKVEEKLADHKQEKTKNNNSHFFVDRDTVDVKNMIEDQNQNQNLNLETLVKTMCSQDTHFNKKYDNSNKHRKKRQKNNKKK